MSKKKFNFDIIKQIIPYFVGCALTLALVTLGSQSKYQQAQAITMSTILGDDYKISADQMTELFTVAGISNAFSLASDYDVAANYVIVSSVRGSGQSISTNVEKPIIDVPTSRGVIKHEVKSGETMASIAKKYKVTTDQIRWSNGLKNTNVTVGKVLNIPSRSGIVYTVKSSDTIESIASKYGSSVSEITILNDLETSGAVEGMQILIAGGTLPEKERPEYVPPRPTYVTVADTSIRKNIETVGYYYNLGGPYVRGQCTQWAWYKSGGRIPSNFGNAKNWAANAKRAGYTVNSTPTAGSIFQNGSGSGSRYGHVGWVESVNPDGSIVVTEMNYGVAYRVTRATIPANMVSRFNYIHI